MTDWIDVKFELPDYDCYSEDVLCTDGYSVFVGYLTRGKPCPIWYSGNSHMQVTYWMPLPAMPE